MVVNTSHEQEIILKQKPAPQALLVKHNLSNFNVVGNTRGFTAMCNSYTQAILDVDYNLLFLLVAQMIEFSTDHDNL